MKPLFERLCTNQNGQTGGFYSLEDMKVSIINEVGRILSTRCHHVYQMPTTENRTILDYGIPSPTENHNHNAKQHAVLANEIRLAILSYEPRLLEPQVEMQPPPYRYGNLNCVIRGKINNGQHHEEVRFPISLAEDEDMD